MDRHSGIASLNPLVIVVDDDAAVRNSLKFLLEIDGFAVRTYESAQELARGDDSSDCRCLIVDHEMPHMTGFRTCRRPAKGGLRNTSNSHQRKRDAGVENAGFQPGGSSYREGGYGRWLDRINSHYHRHEAALKRIDTSTHARE